MEEQEIRVSGASWQPEPWMAHHPEITAEQWQAYRNRMSPREWEEYCEQWRAYDRAGNVPPACETGAYYAVPGQFYGYPQAAPHKVKRGPQAKDIIRATWPCLAYFALSFGISFVVMLGMMLPGALNGEETDTGHMYRVLMCMGVALQVLMIPAFLPAFLRDWQKEREAGMEKGRHAVPSALLAVLAAIGMYFTVDGLLTVLMEALPQTIVDHYNQLMEQTIGGMSGLEWLAFISVVLLAPVMEELMMRGLVQRRLESLMPPKAALFVAAVLFGLLHMNVIQSTYAFLLGLFLGWVYQRSKRLIVPVLGHLAFNGMNYVYSVFLSAAEENPGWFGEELNRNIIEQTPLFLGISALTGALLTLLALVLLNRLHGARANPQGEENLR